METTVVRTFDSYISANIILGRLQQSGIHCVLLDEYTVTIDPILTNAVGGIKLAVDKEQVEQALRLLNEFDEEYLRSVICPNCGGNNIIQVSKQSPANIITAVLTWLFSSYAIATEQVYQCQDCGYETEKIPENNTAYN